MAIDDPLDEHEQSERLLEWLRRNGVGLVGGILLGLAAIGGWKWWEQDQQQEQHQLADRYQSAIDAIESDDDQANAKVEALGSSVYGSLARMQLAAAQVEDGDRDAAIATLQAIESEEPAVRAIIDLRVARLLIDAGKPEAALKLISGARTGAALEIAGDAQLALGDRDKARETYAQALAKLDVGSPQRRLLELKLTEVGGSPATTEAKS